MTTFIKKSLAGGLFIAIAQLLSISILNINPAYTILAAFAFSIGLVTIFRTDSNLYTGKIGYVVHNKNMLQLIAILILNLIGCVWIAVLPFPISTAGIIARTTAPAAVIFIRAIVCGIAIYMATYERKHLAFVVFWVMIFILVGGEHCIAAFAYILYSHIPITFEVICFLIIVILGNSLGSILVDYLNS